MTKVINIYNMNINTNTENLSPCVLNMNDICRLCGNMNTNLYSIFEYGLKEQIENFIPIKVRKNNGFPVKICELCKSKLKIMYDFKSLAVSIDKKLHAILNKDHYLLNVKYPFEIESIVPPSNETDNIMMLNEKNSNLKIIQIIDNNQRKQSKIIDSFNNDDQIVQNVSEHNKTNLHSKGSSDVSQQDNETIMSNSDPAEDNIYFKINENNEVANIGQISNQDYVLKMQVATNVEKLTNENTEHNSEDLNNTPLRGRWQTVKDRYSVTCPRCGKIIKKENYKNHMKTHTRIYDKKCNICGALVLTNAQLWYHKKTRHREKRFINCDKCGKQFLHNSHFHVHYRNVHLKIRRYKCKICNALFGRPETLKRHMQTHTGERPHICHLCGRGLSSTSALKHHIRQHTNDTPYKCTECDQCFKQKVSMQLHFKRQHLGITPEQERLAKMNEST